MTKSIDKPHSSNSEPQSNLDANKPYLFNQNNEVKYRCYGKTLWSLYQKQIH